MERLSLQQYIFEVVWPAFVTTLQIMFFTVLISFFVGMIIAIILHVTRPKGCAPNRFIYRTIDVIINLVRSFPFVILMVSLIPVTRFLTGSSIGVPAAIFPLCVSMSPYMGRLIQSHMDEVSREAVEAAKSFGASTFQIIWHVIIVESIPGIASVVCFATVAALGATTGRRHGGRRRAGQHRHPLRLQQLQRPNHVFHCRHSGCAGTNHPAHRQCGLQKLR